MRSLPKDVAKIARYRQMLKQSLNVYGLVSVPHNDFRQYSQQQQSNISIQQHSQQLMHQFRQQQQQAKMEAERQWRVEEERHANLDERASQVAIHGMQDEHPIARMADDAIPAQPPEILEVNRAHEEHQRELLRQSVGGTPSPHPQSYLSPTLSGPTPQMSTYVNAPYFYLPHFLPPPQPLHTQPQGGIILQIINIINSGNSSNVSISNVGNNARCVYPSFFNIFRAYFTPSTQLVETPTLSHA